MIHDRRFAFVFRLFAFVFTFLGLLSALGVFQGNIQLDKLMFYTVQSNALGVILFLILAIKTGREWRSKGNFGKNGYYPSFEMVCVIDLSLTLLVYWFILVPVNFSMYDEYTPWRFNNLVVHLITPLLCLLDYILFVESRSLRYKNIYYVLIFPLAYVPFVHIAGLFGYVFYTLPNGTTVSNPYYFMDFTRIGNKAFLNILGLVIFFLILAHIAYFFDRKVRKPVFPRNNKE